MNDSDRERLNTEAIVNPAPNIAPLMLRPFNDGVLGLCATLNLSLFTLDALTAEASSAQAEGIPTAESRVFAVLSKLGMSEVNRQCHMVFFMLGYGNIEEMISLVNQPDAYNRHVLPWLLKQQYEGSLVPRMLSEWGRFMSHYLAASVKVMPKPGDSDDPRAPKNG